MSAWDTEFGRYILARARYDRERARQQTQARSPCTLIAVDEMAEFADAATPETVDDSRCPATHVTESGDVEQCRYRLNHGGVTTDGWHADEWGNGWLDAPPETADEAFAREIELAREVCEDAEVDALTQPVPTVSLPFGKSD